MDYTKLSLADVTRELEEIARQTRSTFGSLDERQLNWRPDPTQWSVAQCFAHLVAANDLMSRAAGEAMSDSRPRTVWQQLPVLPRIFGRLLIRSQAPDSRRKYIASPKAKPAATPIAADIIPRFVEQQQRAADLVRRLDEREAGRVIMTSPFVRFITYSVLDGWRLVVAHNRRHFEQACRVLASPGFPKESSSPETLPPGAKAAQG